MMKFTKMLRYLWSFCPVSIKKRHIQNIACYKQINLAKQKKKKRERNEI